MRPEQVMFAVSPRGDGVDVLLGVPTAAWEYMKDGKTHTFDMTKLGLPIRIIMYGGPDQITVRRQIDEHNRALGIVGTQNRGDEDFSVRPQCRVQAAPLIHRCVVCLNAGRQSIPEGAVVSHGLCQPCADEQGVRGILQAAIARLRGPEYLGLDGREQIAAGLDQALVRFARLFHSPDAGGATEACGSSSAQDVTPAGRISEDLLAAAIAAQDHLDGVRPLPPPRHGSQ